MKVKVVLELICEIDPDVDVTDEIDHVRGALFSYELGSAGRAKQRGPVQVVRVESIRLDDEVRHAAP